MPFTVYAAMPGEAADDEKPQRMAVVTFDRRGSLAAPTQGRCRVQGHRRMPDELAE